MSYGQWVDFYELQEGKARIAADRGWVPARFWVSLAGNLNDFFLERDYDTLEELSTELLIREADHEFMRLMRDSYKLAVQGSVKVELSKPPKTATSRLFAAGSMPALSISPQYLLII